MFMGNFKTNQWLHAGIIVLVVGILTLVTPAFSRLTPNELAIDLIAGGIMTLTGIGSILTALKSR